MSEFDREYVRTPTGWQRLYVPRPYRGTGTTLERNRDTTERQILGPDGKPVVRPRRIGFTLDR